MLLQNFSKKARTFIVSDNAHQLVSTIKGNLTFWKKFTLEVLTMV